MSGFMYCVPGGGMVTEARLKAAGLAEVFGDEITKKGGYSQRGTSQGPGGKDCQLVCIGDDAGQLYYKPAEQTWQQSLNGKFYIGIINSAKPTEEELRRAKQLAGFEVELGDGGRYLIPVARIITGGSALPQSLILGKNGEVVTEALPKYAQFSAKAEKLWHDFRIENKLEEGETELSIPQRMEFATEALCWNYHIGIDESNILKLLTTENLGEIMTAIVDVPTLVAVMKQTEAEKKNTDAAITDG